MPNFLYLRYVVRLSLFLLAALHWNSAIARWDNIDIKISVQDNNGKPIPYVTVWRVVLPCHLGAAPADYPCQSPEELLRLAQRTADHFEVITRGNQPANRFSSRPMTDGNGALHDVLDFDAYGAGTARPTAVRIAYVFLKRGYLPQLFELASESNSDLLVRATMQADQVSPAQSREYLNEFDAIRFELSDSNANRQMTVDNHERIQRLKERLEVAASAAIVAGDKPAAARMYARLQWFPAIRFMNGKVIGFSQGNGNSPEGWAAFSRAAELDPQNAYIGSWRLMQEGWPGKRGAVSGNNEVALAAYVKDAEAWFGKQGEKVWPWFRATLVPCYLALGEFEKAEKWVKETQALYPYYMNYSDLLTRIEQEKIEWQRRIKKSATP